MKSKVLKRGLTVPHEGGEICFQHPIFKGIYASVAEQIDNNGLQRPNSPQIASLAYDAFQNPNKKYQKEIIKILKENLIYEYTGNLYLPKSNAEINNGVILEINPVIEDRRLSMDKPSLIKMLDMDILKGKFVPFGYKIGEQTWQELEKNAYIIARYGEKGASKIAEIASMFKLNPRLLSFDSIEREKITMSSLGSDVSLGKSLDIDSMIWYGADKGHGLGLVACARN